MSELNRDKIERLKAGKLPALMAALLPVDGASPEEQQATLELLLSAASGVFTAQHRLDGEHGPAVREAALAAMQRWKEDWRRRN